MANYVMEHSGEELDEAIGYVLDNYKDVSPVTARAQDVVFGKIIVTPEGPVTGSYQGVVPPASWRKTASGKSVTITDGMADWPLHSLSAEIGFTQAGSGDPSPNNVRPIGGRDGAEVTQNGSTAVSVEFPETPGTVYGGTLNLATGELTVTHVLMVFNGEESWTRISVGYADGTMFHLNTLPVSLEPFEQLPESEVDRMVNCHIVSNEFTRSQTGGAVTTAANTIWYNTSGTALRVKWGVAQAGSTLAQFREFLASSPLQVLAPVAEPVTYQLAPQEMPLLAAGTNSFAADTGGVTVTYYSAPDDPVNPTVQSLQSSPVSLSMAAPTADPMDEPEEVDEE